MVILPLYFQVGKIIQNNKILYNSRRRKTICRLMIRERIIAQYDPENQGGFAAVPYLDNIETSCPSEKIENSLCVKAFETSDDKKLYTFAENMAYYKKLSCDIANTLIGCTSFDDPVYRDRANKILACGCHIAVDEGGGIVSADFCRQRLCPMCQKRRSLRVASDFHRIMEHLSCSWVHLVLTVPNCNGDELSELLDSMQECSSRFFKYAPIKKAFEGVARCTEISYNSQSDTYHPHFHCLVAVKKSYFKSRYYLPFDYLRRVWSAVWYNRKGIRRRSDEAITNHISELDNLNLPLLQLHIGKADGQAVIEIAKYSVKPLELDLLGDDLFRPLDVIFRSLHSRRLIQTYGTIRTAAHELNINLDSDDVEELDRTNVRLYNWNWSVGEYVETFSL